MAAIIPHLEVQDDTTYAENAYDVCVGSLNGLTFGEGDPGCPTPNAVLQDAHAGLIMLAYVREGVARDLAERGVSFRTQIGDRSGGDKRGVYLVLDEPIGRGPLWNPSSNPNVSQYGLLSWTSKMNAPSWSIPAGATNIGGTCPGATAGQSIVDEKSRTVAARKHVLPIMGKDVNLAQAICERCYATGGQYSTGSVQYAQMLRNLWVQQAIRLPAPDPSGGQSTAFVETMVYAIANANYRLDGGNIKVTESFTDEDGVVHPREVTQKLLPEPTGRRFFRIHDSGDFFSAEYLAQWKQIADRLPDITFWAPSRIWATGWGIEAVNQINRDQGNLIIRPSGYEVNEHAPPRQRLGDGWAAGTTVIHVQQNGGMTREREQHVSRIEGGNRAPRTDGHDLRYTWDCRAYAATLANGKPDTGHTCRKAAAPPGFGDPSTGKGCRACWIAPNEIVNYSLH